MTAVQAIEPSAAAGDITADTAVFDHPAANSALQTLLGPVAKQLRTAAALAGNFMQRKQLHELPKPLLSSGDFYVARGIGVDWHTRKPFDSELVLMPQALIQRSADGTATHTDASQQPGLQAVSHVFDALFALDLDKLAQTFVLYGLAGAKAGDEWILGMEPREPALAKLIQRIVVTGVDVPRRIVIFESSGDRTAIDFGAVAALTTVSETDRKRFTP